MQGSKRYRSSCIILLPRNRTELPVILSELDRTSLVWITLRTTHFCRHHGLTPPVPIGRFLMSGNLMDETQTLNALHRMASSSIKLSASCPPSTNTTTIDFTYSLLGVAGGYIRAVCLIPFTTATVSLRLNHSRDSLTQTGFNSPYYTIASASWHPNFCVRINHPTARFPTPP